VVVQSVVWRLYNFGIGYSTYIDNLVWRAQQLVWRAQQLVWRAQELVTLAPNCYLLGRGVGA
jgi:hypothetical protein